MSVRTIQIQRAMEDILRSLLVTGTSPTTNDLLNLTSRYFSLFPAGVPLPTPWDYLQYNQKSDVDKYNQILAHLGINLEVLYESVMEQITDLMGLHTTFDTHLALLNARRISLETKIDDFLLSQTNTDGYFYSVSDQFVDTTETELAMTTCYVDTEAEALILSSLSGLTKQIDSAQLSLSNIAVTADGKTVPFKTLSPFKGAVNGLGNSFWAFEIDTLKKAEVIVTFAISIGRSTELHTVSRIDYTPYGIVPTQAFVETQSQTSISGQPNITYNGFGNKIATSLGKIIFSDQLQDIGIARFTLRKTEPDYLTSEAGTTTYKYIFGAREIAFFEQVYSNAGTFVSIPLEVQSELSQDMIIDAVSITTVEELPTDTSLSYYVAADVADATSVGDFNWKPIVPVTSAAVSDPSSVVRFDGAQVLRKFIRADPGQNDLQLVAPDVVSPDLSQRNPSAVIVPGVDIFRLCKFEDQPLLNSFTLEEGVNTVRIYSTTLDTNAPRATSFLGVPGSAATDNLDYWASKIGPGVEDPLPVAFGRIDVGNNFFYGGDVGQSGVSVYVETFLDMEVARDSPVVAEFRKAGSNSLAWDVRVLLNGRNLAFLPAGTAKALIPWPFQKGLNHISLLINIPLATQAVPGPYLGTVSLLGDDELFNYGTVKLGTWSYVDYFDLQYNQVGSPQSFSIKDGEIISRREPTDNFRLVYATPTNIAPNAIRLRAEMGRSINNHSISPILHSYRVRFSYGGL